MEKKYPIRQDQQQERKKPSGPSQSIPAIVEEVVGRTDTRGAITQVRCKVLDGPERNKILRRNVKGPIREKDIIILRETEIEARSMTQAKRGKKR